MTTDITKLAQSLKAAAEKATPGEWVYFHENTSVEYDVGSDESQGSILYVDSGDFTKAQTDRNGEFIALANPSNIKMLVEALEKAQSDLTKERDARVSAENRACEMSVAELVSQVGAVQQVDDELCKLLPPGVEYMDPPDGGNVTPLEGVRRMVADYRQRIAELESRAVKLVDCDFGAVQHMSGGSIDYCHGFVDGTQNAIRSITAAGIKVEAE